MDTLHNCQSFFFFLQNAKKIEASEAEHNFMKAAF